MSTSLGRGQRHPRPTPALEELGRRVAKRRKELQLSVRQFADGREFSISWVSEVETGKKNPTLASLVKLAEALDIPLSELVRDLPTR